MRRARLTTQAVAAIFLATVLAIGVGVTPAGSGGDSSGGPWDVGETEESAVAEANPSDPSEAYRATSGRVIGDQDSGTEGWNEAESDADEWGDDGWEDEDWTDEESEPVEGESDESFSDRCHGVVSCTFMIVGEVIALPFRILDGAFRIIF